MTTAQACSPRRCRWYSKHLQSGEPPTSRILGNPLALPWAGSYCVCALTTALDGAAASARDALRPLVTSVSQEAQAVCAEIAGFKFNSKKAQAKTHSDSEDAGLLAEEHAALEEGRSAHGRQIGMAEEERPQGKKCTCAIQ